MVISRDRFLDDGRRFHVTLSLASHTIEMHSLLTGLGAEGQQQVGDILVRALNEIQHLLQPAVARAPRSGETSSFGCGT